MYDCPSQCERDSDGCCNEMLFKKYPGLSSTSKKERFTAIVSKF